METDESRLIFQWVNTNELEDYKIYPVFLKDKVTNILDLPKERGYYLFVLRIEKVTEIQTYTRLLKIS